MRKGDLALSGAETADSAAPGQVPPGPPAAAGGALRAETWPIIRRGELAHREAFTLQIFGVAAAVAGIFALAFAMIGPFESHHVLTLAQRLAYCAVSGGLHLIVAYAGFVATLYLTRGRTELQTVVVLALEVLVMAAPCTAITYAVYGVYAHLHLSSPVHDFRIIREIYYADVPSLFGATALVYYVLRLRVAALQGAGGGASAEMRPPNATTPAGRVPDAFLALLPEGAGRDIVHLRAAGHYVKVTTTTGTAVILLRFGDAIGELGDSGMQVHRGYWIAHDHVVAIVRRGTLMALRLTTGDVVPVSRPFLAATRQRYRAPHRHDARQNTHASRSTDGAPSGEKLARFT